MYQDDVYKYGQGVQIAFKDNVFLGFNELRNEGVLIDIKLNANGELLNAHKVVLAAHSKYFKKIFTSGFKESKQEVINLVDTDPNLFEKILDAIYKNNYMILNTWEDLLDTIDIIDYYQFEPALVIIDQSRINAKNRVKDYIFLINSTRGKNYILNDYENSNIGTNLKTAEEILDLSDEQINTILSNYYVGDATVYQRIIKDLKEKYHRNINPGNVFGLTSFDEDKRVWQGQITAYTGGNNVEIRDKSGEIFTFYDPDLPKIKPRIGDIVTFEYIGNDIVHGPSIFRLKIISR